MSRRDTLRIPINQAASKGVSWINGLAEEHRVILTKFGNPTSVIDSAESLDEVARVVADTRRLVVENFADVTLDRSDRLTLEQVCEQLGIDVERVKKRSAEIVS